MNGYIIHSLITNEVAVVDPGADPDKIMAEIASSACTSILITHGHNDHVGALDEIKAQTGAPVYLHPDDASRFGMNYDYPLFDGVKIDLGTEEIIAIHAPGHTPGQTCFRLDPLDDPAGARILVGDTIFVGGPGHTNTADEFRTTMDTMQQVVFAWPNRTRFYPGHGPKGLIGKERPAFNRFVIHGWSPDLHGDVTWE
jgi:glyoxylase-like metal-dependent hydrolase (beta-lactamase superfamily II)